MDKSDLHLKTVVPVVTPATPEGRFDEWNARRIYDHIVNGGCGAVMVLGTNGEGPSVPSADRPGVVQAAVSQVGDRALVLAGVGDTSLANCIEAGFSYFRLGVHAVVAQAPAYFPVGQEEIIRFFHRLADALPGPLLVYNIPVTTRISLTPESIDSLSLHPKIIGLKDSDPDPERQAALAARYRDREDFVYFSGAAGCFAACLESGGSGTVPSLGNFAPAACQEIIDAAAAGDSPRIHATQERMLALSDIYHKGRALSRAVPCLKIAMAELGLCDPHVFPPLLPATSPETLAVRAAIQAAGPIR